MQEKLHVKRIMQSEKKKVITIAERTDSRSRPSIKGKIQQGGVTAVPRS